MPEQPFEATLVITGILQAAPEGSFSGVVQLLCDDGMLLHLPISRRLDLRARRLSGQRVQVRGYVRTRRSAHLLLSRCRVQKITPAEGFASLNQVTLTGKVIRMDKCEMVAVLRVFSVHLPEPFLVHALGENHMLNVALDFFSARIEGHVDGDLRVVADRICNCRVVVPEAFRNWAPIKWQGSAVSSPSEGASSDPGL